MARFTDFSRVCVAAACLWGALATPLLRVLLESTMTRHMLAQLPLLALTGYAIGRAWWAEASRGRFGAGAFEWLQRWNAGGFTGVIAAGFVMVLWMLPRGLDAARLDLALDAVKFLTVPVAGLAVAVSWRRLPIIARGVIHLEVIATLVRFGWGYMAADERLCLAYLAGDQQLAGQLLLWAGATYGLVIVWRPLFGHPGSDSQAAREVLNESGSAPGRTKDSSPPKVPDSSISKMRHSGA